MVIRRAVSQRRLFGEKRANSADGNVTTGNPILDRLTRPRHRCTAGVSEGVNALRGPDLGVLVITHYQRILNYIKPDFVHIMLDGRIVESGGPELALHLEEHGYDWLREKSEVSAS
jgi:hypothetical protein